MYSDTYASIMHSRHRLVHIRVREESAKLFDWEAAVSLHLNQLWYKLSDVSAA